MTGSNKNKTPERYVLERWDFPELFTAISACGYQLIGPTLRDGAVTYAEISAVEDLPIGYTDDQEKGTYRLCQTQEPKLFDCGLGPHSWKKYLFPSQMRLWRAQRSNSGFTVQPESHTPDRIALIGVRACELHAIAIQDRIFMGGTYIDPTYQAQREKTFIVAVNCGHANKTCFCASMQTGPQVESGYDLALNEVYTPERHYFLVESGSPAGEQILHMLPTRAAAHDEIAAADAIIATTAAQMERALETPGLKDLLYASYDHPRWDVVSARCLACGNCTMVCPTCFCTTVEDVTDLSGDTAERWRKWDSCFTMEFSYIVGGSIRPSAKARYRQWLTHKLATWIDQFDTMGCVGCGRCITWCPVGIDITEEVRAIQMTSAAPTASGSERKKKRENA
jgi:ferredoxin